MTKIAINGLGEIGKPLAHFLARDGRLAAVNDINPENLFEFKKYD